jgi:hypothetical protein
VVIGLLVIGSLSLRRTRRARRRRLRVAERELRGQLLELKDENTRLRRSWLGGTRPRAGWPAWPRPPVWNHPRLRARVSPPLADHQVEPIYEEARRVARLRSSFELSVPSTHR